MDILYLSVSVSNVGELNQRCQLHSCKIRLFDAVVVIALAAA